MRLKRLLEEYERLTVDLGKWWKYPPDKVMAFVYWTQRQIPPTDTAKRARAWEDIKRQLTAQFPPPSGQAGSEDEHPLDKLAGRAMSDPEPDFSNGKEPDA